MNVQVPEYIINENSIDTWKPFYIYDNLDIDIRLNNDISTIYKIWKNNNYKQKINNIINIIYTIDIVDSISYLKDSPNNSSILFFVFSILFVFFNIIINLSYLF